MNLGHAIRLILTLTLCLSAGCSSYRQRRIADSEYQRALLADKNGESDVAIVALQRATVANPKLTPAHEMLGGLYKDRGDYEQAGKEYETLTQLEPKASTHFYDLGLMQQLLGRLQKAAESYAHAIQLQPADGESQMNLGLVYLSLGDHQKAVEHLRQATALRPGSIVAWTNLGVALDDDGDLIGGEKAYRKALELEGDRFSVFVNYAGNLLQQNRPDEAIKFLQQAADMKDTPLVQKRMGDALAAKGWSDASIARYERAIKLDPRYVGAYNALANTLIAAYDRGMQLNESLRERAVIAWQTSLSIKPEQPAVAERLAKWKH